MAELEVEVYGKKYTLRGSSMEEIRAVAALVDQRMKELFGAEPRGLDLGKALALAMNFAEEICNLKKEAGPSQLAQRLEKFAEKLSRLEKLLEI